MAPRALVAIGIAIACWPAAAEAQGGKKKQVPPASSVKPPGTRPTKVPTVKPKVAVIDLRGDEDGKTLTDEVLDYLRKPAYLNPEPTIISALGDPLGVEEDANRIKDARDFLTQSRDLLVAFDAKTAATRAADGQSELLWVTPTAETTALMADLALAEGHAYFVEGKLSDAKTAFALLRRLAPERTLDARYVPEMVAAFKAATSKSTTTLSIKARGSIWVDGHIVGEGDGREPLAYQVPAGIHVVVAFGRDRHPRGRRITESETAVEIEDYNADLDVKVKRARRALIAAPDATAKSSALDRIASLTGIDCAFLITRDPKRGGPAIQRWLNPKGDAIAAWGKAEIRGLNKETPVSLDDDIEPVLVPLLPPLPEPDAGGGGGIIGPPIGPIDTERWWEPRWVQVLGGGALLTAVFVSAYLISTAGADERPVGFEGARTP
jgi:hypothetical protein